MMEEMQQKQRRPSRFEVIPAPDILKLQKSAKKGGLLSPHNAKEKVNKVVFLHMLT